MRRYLSLVALVTICLAPELLLAASSIKVKVKLADSTVDRVDGVSSRGKVFRGTVNGSVVTISVPSNEINGSSLYATAGGRLVGPVFAPKGTNGLLYFVKKPTNPKGKALKTIALKLKTVSSGDNFVMLTKTPKGKVFNAKVKYVPSDTPVLGLNIGGTSSLRKLAAAPNIDPDLDGVVTPLDVDADGDGINNMADPSTDLPSTSRVGASDVDRVDIPFTALYLNMNETLNWHINGALTSAEIDSVIGGENKFSIAFFFALPPGNTTGITGGHVVCGSSLRYCRPTVGSETGTGVYAGFSEGNQSIVGQLWSSLTTDGSEYSLESFQVGGSADPVYAASIQPRVGTEYFRPGDTYRVDFTNASGDVVSSSALTLPPYFLTVPAVRAYNLTSNDAGSDVLVDYADTSGPGMNSSNPIVLATTGDFAGKLRLNVFRLQRLAVSPDESGSFRDYGHLNYGVLVNNNSGEFTCGGLYESLSSTLTEQPSTGQGGSFSSSQGALLWPLSDSADDYEPSSATDSTTLGNNTVSFTVNLADCLDRNGLSPGVHRVTITAAGADTGHGSNRAAQTIYVNIP